MGSVNMEDVEDGAVKKKKFTVWRVAIEPRPWRAGCQGFRPQERASEEAAGDEQEASEPLAAHQAVLFLPLVNEVTRRSYVATALTHLHVSGADHLVSGVIFSTRILPPLLLSAGGSI